MRTKDKIFKFLLCIAVSLSVAVPSQGQETYYTKKCGDTVSEVVYRQIGNNGLEIFIDSQKTIHRFDSNHHNVSWKVIDPSHRTDVTVTLKKGIYYIVGIREGKRIDKTVKSEGLPWVQNLAYFCGVIVPEDGALEYECFRPGTFTLHRMTASICKEESSSTRTCVRSSLSGIASKLFHSDYFFSPETGKLNGYKAVEGGPGTPVTTWTPVEK